MAIAYKFESSSFKSESEMIKLTIQALTGSVREVYFHLRRKPLKVSQLRKKTKYSPRTIRNAVKFLLDRQLIRKIPDMSDLRSHFYVAS